MHNTDESIQAEIDDASAFAHKVNRCLVDIEMKLTTSNVMPATNLHDNHRSRSESPESGTERSIKLPKLELPKFDGDVLTFQGFWNQFKSCIDEDDGLSEIQKFLYLKGVLKGEASELISGLTLSAANYQKAIELLRDRFGNKQILITKHLDVLATLPRVENINDVVSLRKFFDTLETSVRNLSVLGKNTESYGSLLISVIFDRIPNELQVIIARRFNDDDWTLDQVIDIFKEELQARERCAAIAHTDNKEEVDPVSTQVFFARGQYIHKGDICVFCDQKHPSTKCTIVTDIGSRINILRSSRRCFLCLKKGHFVGNCFSKMSCAKCKEIRKSTHYA